MSSSAATSNNSKQNNIVILDAAMGTRMIDYGMAPGVCPEEWALLNPDAIREIYREYMNAGSQSILTASFGANRIKLKEYGLELKTASINRELAELAKKAAFRSVEVGGDIGSCGQNLQPNGDLSFNEAVDVFAEQAAALAEGGVDYFAIETIMDLQEARAAVIACRQVSSLPIHVTLSFQNGRTLMGDTPDACAVVLQALGASAVGCNCGASPKMMLPIVESMVDCLNVPLIAKPNAGKPVLRGNKTRYDMSPEEFASEMMTLAAAGARRIGGCCGTTAAHISALKQKLESMRFIPRTSEKKALLASSRMVVHFADAIMMGNIKLEGSSDFLDSIQNGDYDAVFDIADSMVDSQVFCVSAVADGVDEVQALTGIVTALSSYMPQPLALRPASPEALEVALRHYSGRPLIILDQVSRMDRPRVLSIANHYGAIAILQ